MPPSPWLSARMMYVRYFTTTTSMIAQKTSDRMPITLADVGGMPDSRAKHSLSA